jgi:LysM repeat protein
MRTLTKICSPILAFSLLSGVLFVLLFIPLRANAGFFSVLGSGDALAQIDQVESTDNSQTMDLLQANVSSASVFQDPKGKSTSYGAGKSDSKDSQIDSNTSVNIVSDNAILPATGPLGMADETVSLSLEDTSIYVVRKGDSIGQIAAMFDVSVNTILSANDMKKWDKLKEGDILFILPISGLEHTVVKGQTLKNIAKLYKVDVSDIALYNGIAQDSKLAVGDKLLIPGGEMMDEGGDKPAPNLNTAPIRDQNYYALHPLQNLIGYFVNPLPAGHKTQGLHGPGKRGIDIGAPTGTDIYASAPGSVIAIKTGCKLGARTCGGGYGNMVIVQHPNGTKTLYAHMSKVLARTGDQVNRGQILGYVGSTGRSTGPHIHFEVFNARNPGASWSWAN